MKRTRSLLPPSYAPLLAELKSRVRTAQVKAALTVNRELIRLYWQIGRTIVQAQQAEGWGAKVVERLAKDLAAEFPEMSGLSALNLQRMRAFYAVWTSAVVVEAADSSSRTAIVSQPVTELQTTTGRRPASPIVSRAVTQLDEPPEPLTLLSWSTNLILLHKLKDPATRLWYAQQAVANGWSRAVLTVQIESRLHRRSGKAITNFDRTLPPGQSDLAKAVLKDPYTFDFLTLGLAAHERDLERGLVEHVQKLLLELGAGFAFVGRQVHVEVGDEDFYLDLLFYHLRLRCFVVVDLKMEPFEPKFAGKMNFYLSVVDDRMRHRDDAPNIGLLLCKDAKKPAQGRIRPPRREEAHRGRSLADAARGSAAQETARLPADH